MTKKSYLAQSSGKTSGFNSRREVINNQDKLHSLQQMVGSCKDSKNLNPGLIYNSSSFLYSSKREHGQEKMKSQKIGSSMVMGNRRTKESLYDVDPFEIQKNEDDEEERHIEESDALFSPFEEHVKRLSQKHSPLIDNAFTNYEKENDSYTLRTESLVTRDKRIRKMEKYQSFITQYNIISSITTIPPVFQMNTYLHPSLDYPPKKNDIHTHHQGDCHEC